jgi:hypothetical protein
MPKQDESQELDLTVYTDKPASPLQQHFAEWIPGVTGYEPNSAKSKTAAFQMGVKLALNTHKFFQKSEDNKSRNAELMEQRAAERAEREALKEQKAAEREAAKAIKGKAPAAKAPAKKAAAGKPTPTKPAAKKLPARPAKKAVPAKKSASAF